ncbi:hypothetical protein NKH57_09295 [Mesorhizobium sp. M1050]|uniref:hypothetical protein n=1 Tax=Mesorhizobium sp. M1050 TaxID=2957051 RepID=UPI00333C7A8E
MAGFFRPSRRVFLFRVCRLLLVAGGAAMTACDGSATGQSWRRLGLRILPGGAHPLVIAIGAGLAFGAYMALADAILFRDVTPAAQIALVAGSSALERIAHFARLAVLDELEFRLVAMSIIAWLLVSVAGKQAWCFWAAILLTALVVFPAFHLPYLSALTPSFPTALREIMLHGGAGILWGYLYWRHGLVAAIAAHVSAHLSLQPLLAIMH